MLHDIEKKVIDGLFAGNTLDATNNPTDLSPLPIEMQRAILELDDIAVSIDPTTGEAFEYRKGISPNYFVVIPTSYEDQEKNIIGEIGKKGFKFRKTTVINSEDYVDVLDVQNGEKVVLGAIQIKTGVYFVDYEIAAGLVPPDQLWIARKIAGWEDPSGVGLLSLQLKSSSRTRIST